MATKVALITASVLVLSGLLGFWRFGPPAPRAADAPSELFSAGRARADLEPLLADGPHPVGSPANAAVRERILARLSALGYEPSVHRGFACDRGQCAIVHNIVAKLAGSDASAVALVAHYDSVPAAPGAADDGAGVAALLEIARILRNSGMPRNTVLLLLTDGEELGMLGARAILKDPIADRIRAVVNLEARGSSGASIMFETSGPSAPLARLLSALDRPVTGSLFAGVYEMLENRTDLTVFRGGRIAGYNFAFIDNLGHYHTPADDLAHLSLGSLQHHGDNALALARALSAADLEQLWAGDERAVWFDFLSLFVVRWPASWSLPLALLALALVGAMGALRVRQLRVEQLAALKGWLACFGLPLFALLLGAVIGMLAVATLTREGRPTEQWGAAGVPARIALWVGAIAPCAIWSWIAGRRIDPWVHFAGVWSLWGGLAVVVAWRAPFACYLFIVPTLVAGVLAVAMRAHRCEPDSIPFLVVTLAPAFVAGCLWFTLAIGLGHALGPVGHFAISASVALPVIAALPALARFEPRFAYPLGIVAAVVAAPIAIAALLPDYDAAHPQRLNIIHFQHDQTAEWWLDATWGPIPETLRSAAASGASGPPPVPMNDVLAVATAPAPRIEEKTPDLEVRGDRGHRGRRHLTARLRSRRGAHVVGLLIPPEARLIGMSAEATPLRALTVADGRYAGHAVVYISGVPPEGIDIAFGFAAEPKRLIVFDLVHRLPEHGEPLRAARGAAGVPAQFGDVSLLAATIDL
ncbi:MAG TPA: M20/M25/M40 family metallo-hydrolase [Polyangiaceae bacterium]|nr:M20/M25/M40 family metallo-hydrolase [Polyangiaceae bacterium]